MALDYQIKINGTTLDATIGVSVYDKLEEALDEAGFNLPITTLGYPQNMLGLLEISASDGNDTKTFNLLVISDSVGVESKDGFYNHSLTAIEYTHKLDKMFISALSFTKPFERRSRAPFEWLDETLGSGSVFSTFQLFPKVEFDENYLSNETITIASVNQAYTNINSGQLKDVYIRSTLPGYFTARNLTASSLEFNMPSIQGDYTFEVGFMSNDAIPQFVPIFKHYIRVIKERRYTLKDMVDRVRAVLPIERESFFNNTRLFDLDSNLETLFESIDMPQMFFRQQSARQILNTMFKYINAISRLIYVDGASDTLTVDFFNKLGSAFSNGDIVDLAILQDAQNYGTKAISFLGNALQSNFRDNPSVNSPAKNLYKTVRSSDVQLTQSSFELKLEKPIYELSKITVVFPKVKLLAEGQINSYNKTINNIEVDITHRVLEKTFWDLKSSTVDIVGYQEKLPFQEEVGMRSFKNGNIFWERNSKSIKFNPTIGSVILTTLLEEMLQESFNEEITLSSFDTTYFGSYTIPNGELPLENVQISLENAPGLDFNAKLYRNVKFNIEYITLEDTVAQVDRQDLTDNDYDAYMRINEGLAISNYERATRDIFGKLERSAVPVKTISKIHTSIGSILDVGQIDVDGFIITERKLIFHNDFIEGIYTVTKNHNRLNEFNGINQEFRAFETPTYGQSVKRKDFYADYIFLTKPTNPISTTDSNNLTLMNSNKVEELFLNLSSSTYLGDKKITFSFLKTDGFEEQYPDASNDYKAIMTPVVSFGGKGGLNFTFDFESNLIAGSALMKSDDNNIYNEPIWYTDSQGFFDKLWFAFGSEYNDAGERDIIDIGDSEETYFNETYQYPLIRQVPSNLGQNFIFQNGTNLNPDWFLVYKDAASSYGFSYHLAIIPFNFTEYVIGQKFYTNNPLVYNGTKEKTYLYIYSTLTKYNKFDDLKVKSGWSDRYEITNSVFTDNSLVYTFQGNYAQYVGSNQNWAIGDIDGNLLLACNDNTNGFKIFARHLHPNLTQIGNK